MASAALMMALATAQSSAQPQPAQTARQLDAEQTRALEQPIAPGSSSSKHPTEQSPLPIKIVQTEEEARLAKARDDKSDKHDADDLDAQVRTAVAAERQVFYGSIAALLSLLANALLLGTLVQTWRIASRDQHAQLFVESIKPIASSLYGAKVGANWMILRVRNFGPAPAAVSGVSFYFVTASAPIEINRTAVRHEYQIIGSGESCDISVPLFGLDDADNAVFESKGEFYAVGTVVYTGLLPKARRTDFCWQLRYAPIWGFAQANMPSLNRRT